LSEQHGGIVSNFTLERASFAESPMARRIAATIAKLLELLQPAKKTARPG
jgi:hypothetical protein